MSGVLCSHCAELDKVKARLQQVVNYLQLDGGPNEDLNMRLLLKEIIPDRKRIVKLESAVGDFKDSLRQITVSKVEGTWGIVDRRADIVFSRLLSVPVNGNGRKPFLSTADVKNILGVRNYAQGKEAMVRCTKRHLDTQIIQRGSRKIGITLLEREE